MMTTTTVNLRDRLRSDTRAAHKALDLLVSRFDLTTRAGLVGYLQMHERALNALMPHSMHTHCKHIVADLHTRTIRDLGTVDRIKPCKPVKLTDTPDPTAIDYVILGSRLGSAVLKKRWMAGTPNGLGQAHFTAPSYMADWHRFCDQLSITPPAGARADRIVADANTLFATYARCATMTLERVGCD